MRPTQAYGSVVRIELFGILYSTLERLWVVHLEIVVDDYLQLIDIEELTLAPENSVLKVEHQLAHFIIIIFEPVFFHLERESNSQSALCGGIGV